jgi:hypothetical protein
MISMKCWFISAIRVELLPAGWRSDFFRASIPWGQGIRRFFLGSRDFSFPPSEKLLPNLFGAPDAPQRNRRIRRILGPQGIEEKNRLILGPKEARLFHTAPQHESQRSRTQMSSPGRAVPSRKCWWVADFSPGRGNRILGTRPLTSRPDCDTVSPGTEGIEAIFKQSDDLRPAGSGRENTAVESLAPVPAPPAREPNVQGLR